MIPPYCTVWRNCDKHIHLTKFVVLKRQKLFPILWWIWIDCFFCLYANNLPVDHYHVFVYVQIFFCKYILFKVCMKQFVSNMLINFHELNISALENFCFSFLQFFQHYYTLKSSKIPVFSMLTGGHLKNVGSTQNVTSFSLLLSLFLQGIISHLCLIFQFIGWH